jgi:hypothetical protein
LKHPKNEYTQNVPLPKLQISIALKRGTETLEKETSEIARFEKKKQAMVRLTCGPIENTTHLQVLRKSTQTFHGCSIRETAIRSTDLLFNKKFERIAYLTDLSDPG